jgi:hypothetical protein
LQPLATCQQTHDVSDTGRTLRCVCSPACSYRILQTDHDCRAGCAGLGACTMRTWLPHARPLHVACSSTITAAILQSADLIPPTSSCWRHVIAPNVPPDSARTRQEGNPIRMALSAGPTLSQVVPAPADEPLARSRALRRATTESRFQALPPEIQGLAVSFRPLTFPRIRHYPQLAAATLLV